MSEPAALLAGHRLTVYSSHGCPDCSRLDRWMQQQGIAHEKVWIDEDPAAAEKLEAETGKQAVPFVLVDGAKWVRGYHREERSRFSESTFLREIGEAFRR